MSAVQYFKKEKKNQEQFHENGSATQEEPLLDTIPLCLVAPSSPNHRRLSSAVRQERVSAVWRLLPHVQQHQGLLQVQLPQALHQDQRHLQG